MRKTLWMAVVAIVAMGGMAVAGDYEGPVVDGDRVIPDYPPAALAAGFEGVVSVAAVINSDGSVGAIEVIEDGKPHLGFGDAAIQAVKNWQFHSARVDGQPVDAVGAFVFRFQSVGRVEPSAYVGSEFVLSQPIGIRDGLVDKNTPVVGRTGAGGFSPATFARERFQKYKKPPGKPYQLYDRTTLIPENRKHGSTPIPKPGK